MKVQIILNGTEENPWHELGLRANPFPGIPKWEAAGANAVLRALDSEPIVDESDLRSRLEGCTPEFIEGCVERFEPGKRVKFIIEFPNPWDREDQGTVRRLGNSVG
jgi:hypothetical protein